MYYTSLAFYLYKRTRLCLHQQRTFELQDLKITHTRNKRTVWAVLATFAEFIQNVTLKRAEEE